MAKNLPFYKQTSRMDCGPACLRMVAKYYGRYYKSGGIKATIDFSRQGVSLFGLAEAANSLGFTTQSVRLTFEELIENALLPCILHWNQNHFVVLYPFQKTNNKIFRIADPSDGILKLSAEQFKQHWLVNKSEKYGNALLLEPTAIFYSKKEEEKSNLNWGIFFRHIKGRRWQILQVCIALIITSAIQLVFPFLTKSIVDIGINSKDLSYVSILLAAQLMLIFSRNIVDFVRSRLLLYISGVLNLSILSDFWYKLTHLPLSYFSRYHTGDIMQRLDDHRRIQEFLTGTAISFSFSIVTFFVLASVLVSYNVMFFIIFAIGTLLYYGWIHFFLKLRRGINYATFYLNAKESNATIQLVQGMQEIKLHNAEQSKRLDWEEIQAQIFKLNFKTLSYNQIQQAGALLINQGKDIIISFFAAKAVINGNLTLGSMLAIQYIMGQLTGPVEQFISFLQQGQDAKISMERLSEVHQIKNEEDSGYKYINQFTGGDILLNRLAFSYAGSENVQAIKNVTLKIPYGRVTAIVGASGSGKTTLVKILLKFFDEYGGEIEINNSNFRNLRPFEWREKCGAVLQDGYIFNDTIARNIAVNSDFFDEDSLINACRIANILSFVETLPAGFETKLGVEGTKMSEGQKQRLLIARAIYKNPEYLFFDEATNALDSQNEKMIVQNLKAFFEGRTVVIVAHRLSTVKNADKIVVMEEGEIAEEGSHEYLLSIKGKYFDLIKNQLELAG